MDDAIVALTLMIYLRSILFLSCRPDVGFYFSWDYEAFAVLSHVLGPVSQSNALYDMELFQDFGSVCSWAYWSMYAQRSPRDLKHKFLHSSSMDYHSELRLDTLPKYCDDEYHLFHFASK
ncbi:hypothetical protein CFP56_029098 [Quercus suber]|uniref:Uncharacterized protein n=1 Tax=Quercus suber TaxID=58331 RepID=A0AAW0MEF8_QUESU